MPYFSASGELEILDLPIESTHIILKSGFLLVSFQRMSAILAIMIQIASPSVTPTVRYSTVLIIFALCNASIENWLFMAVGR